MALFFSFLVYLNSFKMNSQQSIALKKFNNFINDSFINTHCHELYKCVHLLQLTLTQSLILTKQNIFDILNGCQFQTYLYLITKSFMKENPQYNDIFKLFEGFFKLQIQVVKDQKQKKDLKTFDMIYYCQDKQSITIEINQYPNKEKLKLYEQLTFFQNIFENQYFVGIQISNKQRQQFQIRFNCPFTGYLVSIIHRNYIQQLMTKDNNNTFLSVINQFVEWLNQVKCQVYDQLSKPEYEAILDNIRNLQEKFQTGIEIYCSLLNSKKIENPYEVDEIMFNPNNLMIFPFIFYILYKQEMYEFYSEVTFKKWEILSRIINQIIQFENQASISGKILFDTAGFKLKFNREFENTLHYSYTKVSNIQQINKYQNNQHSKNLTYNQYNNNNDTQNQKQIQEDLNILKGKLQTVSNCICKECQQQLADVFISNLNMCQSCIQNKFFRYI
ncbi:hypothetical protein ABPG72_006754 [Tetrahymena utriculariae]